MKFEAYNIKYATYQKEMPSHSGFFDGTILFPEGTSMDEAIRLLEKKEMSKEWVVNVSLISCANVKSFE